MKITCISSSNIKHSKKNSTSTTVCNIIKEIIHDLNQEADVEIITLIDFELKPCIGCGRCFEMRRCINDEDFNHLYEQLIRTDGLFIVSAHYAPIPSKLSMLLEKMEQIAFLPRFHNDNDRSPLYHKPVGIIGHGGGTEAIIKGYKSVVINTIANALMYPIEMDIVGINEEWPYGVVFPIKEVHKEEDSIFPIQIYDFLDIRKRIEPLVINHLEKVKTNKC